MIAFAAKVEAVRFQGDYRPVFELLGYEIRGNEVILTADVSLPVVEVNEFFNDPPILSFTLPGHDPITLEYGMWLIKIGQNFTVMHNSEFEKIELAL